MILPMPRQKARMRAQILVCRQPRRPMVRVDRLRHPFDIVARARAAGFRPRRSARSGCGRTSGGRCPATAPHHSHAHHLDLLRHRHPHVPPRAWSAAFPCQLPGLRGADRHRRWVGAGRLAAAQGPADRAGLVRGAPARVDGELAERRRSAIDGDDPRSGPR